MQRREFLKGLVSLPLLAAVPVATLFKPRTAQDILNEWVTDDEVELAEIAVWNKVLSDKEIAFYFNGRAAHPEQMPAFESLQSWAPFAHHVPPGTPPRGQWIPRVDTTPTETVAAWVREAA